MPVRIWYRTVVDGKTTESVLPKTYSKEGGAPRLHRLLAEFVKSRPSCSINGPLEDAREFPRWDILDERGSVAASYRLIGPRDWDAGTKST